MNDPTILQRHPALRWLVPVGVATLAGLAATGVFTARATPQNLPRTTPAALIAAVQHPEVVGFTGTVVSHLSLGLPELPSIGSAGTGTSFATLLSGSHTLQVWYGGRDEQRVALLGSTDETDVFRDAAELWQWSSEDQVAVHAKLLHRVRRAVAAVPAASATLTPDELARGALAGLDPTTRVQVITNRIVADRSAYELILTPRTDATRVGSVHIMVDGRTKVPLGVRVYPRGSDTPAVDVAFTRISFGRQPERNFQFTPPAGATVREVAASGGRGVAAQDRRFSVTGSGWTAVAEIRPGKDALTALRRTPAYHALSSVSGPWGRGRIFDSALVTALVTDNGRIYLGAVEPAELFAAAARR